MTSSTESVNVVVLNPPWWASSSTVVNFLTGFSWMRFILLSTISGM